MYIDGSINIVSKKLTKIKVPSSMKYIASPLITNNDNVRKVVLSNKNDHFELRNNNIIEKCSNTLVYSPPYTEIPKDITHASYGSISINDHYLKVMPNIDYDKYTYLVLLNILDEHCALLTEDFSYKTNQFHYMYATITYYKYSKNKPKEEGYYWHYVFGKPVIWE